MEKFPKNRWVQQVEKELENESDEATCATAYGEVFLVAAEGEVHKFLLDLCLCMDEAFLPVVEQS